MTSKKCKMPKIHKNGKSELHSVVQFEEDGRKMFECIWDGWFVDENRNSCYWPPSKGKRYLLRVLSKEIPDDTWKIYPCVVISEGHATYKSGFDLVKEKCHQTFNTSSADEHEEAKNYRRKHPVLAASAESFEHIFSKDKEGTKRKSKSTAVQKKSEKKKKHLRSETLTGKDISRENKAVSSHSASSVSHQLQDSPQRSCSRASYLSLSSCGSDADRIVFEKSNAKNPENSEPSFETADPRCSTGSLSPISNRSLSAKSRSRSPSSIREERFYSGRRSRSDSRSSVRSRSRSESSGLRNSTRSIRGATSDTASRQESHHSKSRSRSRSTTSHRSNYSRCRSPQASENQFGAVSAAPQPFDFLHRHVRELIMIAKQSSHRIAVNERRIARMEVSINKILVTMTDIRHAINSKNEKSGGSSATATSEIPKGFRAPDLPLNTIPQLITLKRNLKNGEFRAFLLTQESYYCTASRQSDSVVMTAYLKRFISLKLRDEIHFKDAKGKDDEPILMRDFNEIYKFLIDVMVKGHARSNKQLKSSEAHLALRTVWGRTKQMLREQRL